MYPELGHREQVWTSWLSSPNLICQKVLSQTGFLPVRPSSAASELAQWLWGSASSASTTELAWLPSHPAHHAVVLHLATVCRAPTGFLCGITAGHHADKLHFRLKELLPLPNEAQVNQFPVLEGD